MWQRTWFLRVASIHLSNAKCWALLYGTLAPLFTVIVTPNSFQENRAKLWGFSFSKIWAFLKLYQVLIVFLDCSCFLCISLITVFSYQKTFEAANFFSLWGIKKKTKALTRFSFKSHAFFFKTNKILCWIKTCFLKSCFKYKIFKTHSM